MSDRSPTADSHSQLSRCTRRREMVACVKTGLNLGRFLRSGLGVVLCSAGHSSSALAENWRLEPAVSVRETWTDNVGLVTSEFARSDFVTEVSPSLSVRGRGSRGRVDIDYRPTALFYARQSGRNDFLNLLNASGAVEAIERLLFVDARAQITQQAISAFGPQPSSNVNSTSNRTETRVFSLSPYLKGIVGDLASYEVRYQASTTRTQEQTVAQGDSRILTVDLASVSDFASFGWLADFRNASYDFRVGQDVKAHRARGTLIYRIDPELWISARGGQESNDFSGSNRAYSTYGIGLQWAPTARTRVSAEHDKRFFGTGYRYSFRHRTQGISFDLLASKDDTTTTDQLTRNSVGTLFERFSELLSGQIPDARQRAEQVRQLLTRTGIPQEPIPQAGFLSASVQVEKRIEGSIALMGTRNTWTLSGYQRDTRAITSLEESFATDSTLSPEVRELGIFLNLNHRLTVHTSATASAAWQRNRGSGNDPTQTISRRLELLLNRQITPSTSGLVGLRAVRSNGSGRGASDFRENALFGGLTHQF